MDGKLDSENGARKAEIANLDNWAKSENDARKTEIANLKNFAESENASRKTEIANLDNFAKSENDGRKSDIADLNARFEFHIIILETSWSAFFNSFRLDKENSDRNSAESALNTRVDTEIKDREDAVNDLKNRMDEANANRDSELDDLRKKLMRENLFLKSLAGRPMSVCFDAYRTKAYDGGGEENLTFQVSILMRPLQYTLFEKSNFCPKIQFWQKTQHFHDFFTQIFFDNFFREIEVVNS